MRHILLTASIWMILSASYAQDSLKSLPSEIHAVTVFLNGAQVFRKAVIDLPVGTQHLQLTNLPADLDPESIQVKGEGDFTILSVSHQLDYLTEKAPPAEIEKLIDQQKALNAEIEMEKTVLDALDKEKALLAANQQIGGQQSGVSIEELKATADFFRIRIREMNREKLLVYRSIEEKREQVKKLARQLRELNAPKQNTTSKVEIVARTDARVKAKLTISYLVQNAGWLPTYDLRIEDVESPVELAYKAQVFQSSREDWNQVQLTLSTGDPRQRGVKPEILPWYLKIPDPREEQLRIQREQEQALARQIRKSEETRRLEQMRLGTGEQRSREDISRFEQQKRELESKRREVENELRNQEREDNLAMQEMIRIQQQILEKNEQLEQNRERQELDLLEQDRRRAEEERRKYEEEVRRMMDEIGRLQAESERKMSELGRQKDEMERLAKVRKLKESLASLALTVNQVNKATTVEFEIETPYSIPGDGKKHLVEVNQHELEGTYQYYCAPKLDENAYLIAQVVNWEQYHLLEGEANLFFEGTYVGKTLLKVWEVNDTLDISLGRDRDIVVSRTKLTEFNKNQSIGGNRKETRAWEIEVSNKKPQGITLIVEDQLPVSTDNQIEINQISLSNARINEDTGILTWEVALEAGAGESLDFRYSVKYPKEVSLKLE